jgi:hypothetical protein
MADEIEQLKMDMIELKNARESITYKEKKSVSFADSVKSVKKPATNTSPSTQLLEVKQSQPHLPNKSAVKEKAATHIKKTSVKSVPDCEKISCESNVNKESEDKDCEGEVVFQEVRNKRGRRKPPITGTSEEESSLLGVPRPSHLHVWNFRKDTSDETVKQYLRKRIPDIETSVELVLESLKVTRGDYASFRISVDKKFRGLLLEPSFWPKHVMVGNYSFRRPSLTNQKG